MDEITYVSDGEKVSAWFSRPDSSEPCPAVVFCPGYTGTKYAAFYQPYVEHLVGAGIAVLLIDYRGWGMSGGERGLILPLAQVADVRNGLSYLESREDIDSARLGLFGVSFGGGHASYVAGVDDRVRAAVAVSGVADGEDWLRQMRRAYEWRDFQDRVHANRVARATGDPGEIVDPLEDIMIPTPERRATNVKGNVPEGMVPRQTPLHCAEAIIEYRPIDVVDRVAPRAILWLCVDDDVVVPSDHSRLMFARAAEPKRLVVLPGRSHYGAYVEQQDAIADEAAAWYERHL